MICFGDYGRGRRTMARVVWHKTWDRLAALKRPRQVFHQSPRKLGALTVAVGAVDGRKVVPLVVLVRVLGGAAVAGRVLGDLRDARGRRGLE